MRDPEYTREDEVFITELMHQKGIPGTAKFIFSSEPPQDSGIQKRAMVTRYYERGNLYSYSRRSEIYKNPADRDFFLIDCFRSVSSVMKVLNDEGYIYRDVRSMNVVIDDDQNCVVIDYGNVISITKARSDLLKAVKERSAVVYIGANVCNITSVCRILLLNIYTDETNRNANIIWTGTRFVCKAFRITTRDA